MKQLWPLCLIPVSVVLFAASDQPWKDKKLSDWTEEDAKLVLTDSPWAKTAYPTINNNQRRGMNNGRGGQGGQGGRGRGTGINLGGLGIPIGGRGGGGPMGSPGPADPTSGGRYPRQPGGEDAPRPKNNDPQTLILRWESAKPIQEAELKSKNTDAPQIDASHYAVVVYGLPTRFLNADKPKAELKKDGKTTIKQSDFKILRRDEGNMMVFLFPRSKEISTKDKRVEFHAVIGQMEIRESFYIGDMLFDGKLEL
jgi:hypothetical protein